MKKAIVIILSISALLTSCDDLITSSSYSRIPPDRNTYRITGTFYDPGWEPDSNFFMNKIESTNRFLYSGLDLFRNEEWAITINGRWENSIAFQGTTNLRIIDPGNTMGLGSGPTAVRYFKALVDGRYDIELNTTPNPRTLTIVRTGDPIRIPTTEIDTNEWHLVGSMNEWDINDLSFPLLWDEVTSRYRNTFTFEANTDFKIITTTDTSWFFSRGASHVDYGSTQPVWLDLSTIGDVISLTEAGTYTIDFLWQASINATIYGVINITRH